MNSNTRSVKRAGSKSKKALRRRRARRRLLIRRVAAGAIAVAAVALAVLAVRAAPSLTVVIWGLAALLMLGEAALLLPKRRAAAALVGMVALLCVALICAGVLARDYVFDRGRFVSKDTLVSELRVTDAWPRGIRGMYRLERLDMRDSTLTDFSPLTSLTALKSLDIRGNAAFDQGAYDALSSALPECEIRWSIPMGEASIDSALDDVDLTMYDTNAAQLKQLIAAYPGKRFSYTVNLMGRRIPMDAQSVDLTGAEAIDPDGIAEALSLLPGVTRVDLRGTPLSAETIGALTDACPGVRFLCTCDVPSGTMTTEDASVTIASGGYEEVRAFMSFIDYMPNLEYMDARAVALTDAQVAEIQSDARCRKLLYNFTVFGKAVSTQETELDLDKIAMKDTAEIERALSLLPNLTRVSMCGCGLSDEQMGALCTAHPDVKFIWYVHFGKYTLRTDATAFTTNLYANNDYNYTSATFWPLQFCTDLMMLDIGHCKLTSIDAIANMKKLRVLILADNKITDISALAGLEDLEYVELFLNKISDFSPLANKEKLLDLNLYYNPIGDVSPICTCKRLERLWVGECNLSNGKISQLRKALPKTKIVTRGSSSTGNGWRDHKRYKVIKQMYKAGKYIPFS